MEAVGRATNDEMYRRQRLILEYASGPRGKTRQELAEEFEIGERALANIIKRLRKMGHDLRAEARPDGTQVYRLHGSNMLPTPMSRAEAITSVLLTEAVLGTPLIGDPRSAESGKAKVEGTITPEVREQLNRLRQRFAVRLLKAAKQPGEGFFSRVLEGIAENRVLSVTYEKPDQARERRRSGAGAAGAAGRAQRIEKLDIEPWGIFFARRSWYLVARKRPGGELRQYKLARFTRIDVTDRTFEMERGWTIDRYAADMWETMKDASGKRQQVTIEIAAPLAEVVAETMWHPSQTMEHRPDGSMIFRATVSGLVEVRSWVLGMGAGARVLEPRQLREEVAEEIRRMAARLEPR